MKINEEIIENGRKLKRLMENDDFHFFLSEIDNLISELQEGILKSSPTSRSSDSLFSLLGSREALINLKEWIQDTIETGGKELIRQQNLRQSERTREEVNAQP